MAFVSYDGNYLFPTDIGNMSVLKITVDTNRSATLPGDIQNSITTALTNAGVVQFSTLYVHAGGTNEYYCDSPIGLSAISEFSGRTDKLVRDNSVWRFNSNNSNVGIFTSNDTYTGRHSVSSVMIIECADGYLLYNFYYLCNNDIVSQHLGYSAPSGATLGYAVVDGLSPSGISGESYTNQKQIDINAYFTQNPPVPAPIQSTDPYEEGAGASGTGGGGGTFDFSSTDIGHPGLPSIGAYDTGFINLYVPGTSALRALASYMWSGAFDIDNLKKLFANPMDAILGLSIVPVYVPATTSELRVGNISTGISMPKADSQFVQVDCGSLLIEEKWGAYLDYDPYTEAFIYLPYIGTHPISVDDIMGKTVSIQYNVDILSGACSATIKCGGSVLYTFVGQCSSPCPVTEGQYMNGIVGTMRIGLSVGSMVATKGATAPSGISEIASTLLNMIKPSIAKSGAIGSTGGILGIQTPYLILNVPNLCVPGYQNKFQGYPAFITKTLGDLTGYTEIDSIHLENVPCTEAELEEIESILKSGVIL